MKFNINNMFDLINSKIDHKFINKYGEPWFNYNLKHAKLYCRLGNLSNWYAYVDQSLKERIFK